MMPSSPHTHICMVAYTNYPSDARVRREAETLAATPGFQVLFLVLKDGAAPRTYKMSGVTVKELDISKYQGKSRKAYIFSYIKFVILAFTALKHLQASGRLDVVHIHNMPNFLVFSATLSRLSGKKIILDIHDSIPETYLSKFNANGRKKLLFSLFCAEEALCCRFVHKVVCVNHIQKKTLVSRGLNPDKVIVSLNVPDPRIFTRVGSKPCAADSGEAFKLIYHGTVTQRLGIDLAIRAVAMLKNEIPQVEFHVMGKGDDLDDFIQLSKSLGLENRVYFNKKMVPLEELGQVICRMDVGVIANRKDMATELMLPVKMLEYMALGIPVVAPRLETIQHYFTEEMVQYYEPENVDSLAGAILQLYREKDKQRKQAKAAERFFDTYGWETHKRDLIGLYRELVPRR